MEYTLYEISSFTYNGLNGNLAGVVLDAENFNNKIKQEIASNYNYSEIAFVEQSQNCDYKLTFFTPNSEVDLCGHATIAVFGLLKQLKVIDNGSYSVELNAGEIEVVVNGDNILMEQISPNFSETINKTVIANSLNITVDEIDILECQKVSTGLFDIMVPIVNRDVLNNIKPNFSKISQISEEYNCVGYHLFAIDNNKVYTRNFAPLYEIEEECATGSASGALACYLYKNSMLKLNTNIDFYQGEAMNSLSKITVMLKEVDNKINVFVGGSVSRYKIV